MIYFKDQSQKYPIKEEPSSPAENWKDNGETSIYLFIYLFLKVKELKFLFGEL